MSELFVVDGRTITVGPVLSRTLKALVTAGAEGMDGGRGKHIPMYQLKHAGVVIDSVRHGLAATVRYYLRSAVEHIGTAPPPPRNPPGWATRFRAGGAEIWTCGILADTVTALIAAGDAGIPSGPETIKAVYKLRKKKGLDIVACRLHGPNVRYVLRTHLEPVCEP